MSNDMELLTRARGLLNDARKAGLTEARARKLNDEAIELLRQGCGPYLNREAVGALLEIGETTVTRYIMWSRPGFRYEEIPFPAPSDRISGRTPVWTVERAPELLAWDESRPGRGAGGGRPWHKEQAGA